MPTPADHQGDATDAPTAQITVADTPERAKAATADSRNAEAVAPPTPSNVTAATDACAMQMTAAGANAAGNVPSTPQKAGDATVAVATITPADVQTLSDTAAATVTAAPAAISVVAAPVHADAATTGGRNTMDTVSTPANPAGDAADASTADTAPVVSSTAEITNCNTSGDDNFCDDRTYVTDDEIFDEDYEFQLELTDAESRIAAAYASTIDVFKD